MANYRIELKNTENTLISIIDNLLINGLSWDYNRIGGCGSCSFILNVKYDEAMALNFREDYRILIYVADVLVYQGYIDKVTPTISTEETRVFCLGFFNQLKRVALQDYNYKSGRIDQLVKRVMDEEVCPIMDVTSTSSDYDEISYAVVDMSFNNSAYDIIRNLAEIAGNMEWGVRADLSFYFKRRSKEIYYHYFIGEQILGFEPEIDYNPMLTEIYFDGGDVNGFKFVCKASLVGARNHKQVILSNGSITTIEDASRWLRYKLKDLGTPQRAYSAQILVDYPYEYLHLPLGSMTIDDRIQELFYWNGEELWDGSQYYSGGKPRLTIESIRYTLKDNRLLADVSLNGIKSDIIDKIKELETEISQRRND